MPRARGLSLLIVLAVLSVGAVAARARTGAELLPPDPLSAYRLYGADASELVPTTGADLPFTRAIGLRRNTAPSHAWDASLYWPTNSGVDRGDLLLLTFWIRNTNPDGRRLRVHAAFQDQISFDKSLYVEAPDDRSGWTKYAIPFRAKQASRAASVQLFFGDASQSFQIGGVDLVDFGPIRGPAPARIARRYAFYYPGRDDPAAPWRVTALANIERTRKADLTVRVNRSGVPVPGARVRITEQRSDFDWGSAVSACAIVRTCPDGPRSTRYAAAIARDFNVIVFEGDMKWPGWEAGRQDLTRALAWARRRGLRIRGHNLIWPGFSTMPPDTARLDAGDLAKRIDAHFADEAGALKGQVYEWDVVNEPYGQHDVQGLIAGPPGVTPSPGVLGNAAIAGWYKRFADIDPRATPYLNDYAILEQKDPTHEAYDLALLKYIGAHGGVVKGLGFQAHFGQSAPMFDEMQATLDDFDPYVGEYGVTEYDFANIDPALQRDMTTDVMTFIFGQPKFHEFLMWGFWDGRHWLGDAPLYNADWTLKPSGRAFLHLTQTVWRTNAVGVTDAHGTYALRAFKGTYAITATVGGRTCVRRAGVLRDTTITIDVACR